jgi:predicted HAD superfamily hydrolase
MTRPDLTPYKQYRTALSSSSAKVASVDVFDTLLLRNTKSEFERFNEVSVLFSRHLSDAFAKPVMAGNLFWLRIEAARTAYRMRVKKQGAREANIEEILSLMIRALGEEPSEQLLKELVEIELNYEIDQLAPNEHLVSTLTSVSQSGRRVICVSDMYLGASQIGKLIAAHVDMSIIDKVYSSADLEFGKASGVLYQHVLQAESVTGDELVHCGDNYHSDVVMARHNGIDATHTPREFVWRARRKISHKATLRSMRSL